jgi:D-arabinose 1-dehydrogenase-like Zn-dependent alcohol dehydrogenase
LANSTTQDVAAEPDKLGGACVILSTVTKSQAMSAVRGGLANTGEMIVVGASPDPIEVSPFVDSLAAAGLSGASTDSEDTMAFSTLASIRPMIEAMPLERAAEAYERTMSGAAFRWRRPRQRIDELATTKAFE